MTVIKRLWINRCMAEICETTQDGLIVNIHGAKNAEQYKKIKAYLWDEGIIEELAKTRLGFSLDSLKNS